ncbi:hypothetical protein L6164_024727 [Bauhinia variegata]|uniref:Uncharacterized protein n=1 Tax=Bauhinia variegata TaxID=167791 RepID=A0ACB9LYF1_BAUVA|nr:hypothetical protein L6164_024727 [Bauhinia variegata]
MKERALLVANHRTEVDWMYLWDLALRKGSLGYMKYILKSSLMKLPVLGWGFHILEFIAVEKNEQKSQNSQKFAAEVGLPVLTNVLLPKTKGFYACLETLRGSLDAVYDVTIACKNQCPTFLDNAFGVDPSEVHIHVRRVPIEDIPNQG